MMMQNVMREQWRRLAWAAAIVALLLCGGCAHYTPQPLGPAAIQEQLRRFAAADLAAEYALRKPNEIPLDLAAGFGPNEVGIAALLLNPALKAKELERGIAAGQLLSAGLYPNPTFDTRSLPGSTHPTGRKSFETSLSFELLRWQERAANKQTKAANQQAVHYEILSEEWKTVSDARTAYWTVVAARERLRLNSEETGLSTRMVDSVKARIKHGAGTSFDSNLAEMQNLKLQMERQKLESDADAAERALRLAIGLPYDAEIKLRIASTPLAREPLVWKLPALIAALPDSAMMKASEWRYEVSEGELRAAIGRQVPSLKLGPSNTLDFDGHWSSLYGFVGSVDVPIFDRNQGEIKEKCAARDLARADYIAKLQARQGAVAAAVALVGSTERRLAFQESQLLPKARENLNLTEKAYKAGDLSGTEILTAQTLFIESEKSHLDLLIEYRQNLAALEALLGRRLDDLSNGEAKK